MSVPATSSLAPAMTALNELPTDVLNVICTWVNATDRESLVQLALAAPLLFAPAVSASLRAHAVWGLTVSYCPDFGTEIVCSTNDTFSLVGPVGQYQVGSFAAQIDETKRSIVLDKAGHPRWFLLLPQRDMNRQPFSSDLDGQMVLDGASATWSLVPIRAASLQYFTIQRNYEGNRSSRFIPPLCRSLRIIGLVSIINQIQTSILDTVTSLMLDGCSLSMITETQQFFRVLPRTLRSLSIDVMSYYHGQDSAVVLLLENLPRSLRKLSIVLNGSDLASVVWPRCHPCLVKALPKLDHLESCTLLTSTSPASLVQVVQALMHCPRLDQLALRVAVFDEAEYLLCAQLAQLVPTGLGQLQFDVDLRHSNGEIALLRPLKLTLPPAQRNLTVTIPKWHPEMGRILPLAPTLTRLSLMADSPDVDVLF
ncbi:hypothetical protein AMAG_03064 [Allomyces macrogynus ATCC 38327]|uniref:F-box domain-containing protein n=1 Tax=Allomyces macrogynus (strain ATCC 38327) TaxID=578462 RepID=A0A0L0S474_ALLM3|nr:hypothetical protein AMAG_03064 [Allomyces macrogynus ATCC 38327]|eukprot:KNE57343.1 hypothetical protein AMAG_03064 [Allomyces macrogynus ATCC 38327]